MSKQPTIFDYDSSDDEQNDDLITSVISTNDSNLFYNIGNKIIYTKDVLKQYSTKKQTHYTKHPSFTIINKFLTQTPYTSEDQTDKSLASLLTGASQSMLNIEKGIEIVTKSRKLYKKIEELVLGQKPDAIIETSRGECFAALDKYFSKKVQKPDKDDIQAIGQAFGITTKSQTANIKETTKFIGSIQKIDGIQETISSLLTLIAESSELLKDAIKNIIIGEQDPTDNKIKMTFSVDETCRDKTNIIAKANILYKEIEKLVFAQQPDAVIETAHWECFVVLDKYFSKKAQKPDKDDIQAIGQIFDIFTKSKTVDGAKTKEFIKSIQKIDGIQETISSLLNLTKHSSRLLNEEIKTYVLASTIKVNIDLAIHMLCDEDLAILSSQLAEFDQDVNSKIAELTFFNTSTDDKSGTQDFLVSSLLYQKYLKTVAKFTLLRQHGQKLSHVIKVTDKTAIQTTSKFSVGLKRTEEVLSLGTYDNISKTLLAVKNQLTLDDNGLVITIQEILKGENLYKKYSNNIDSVKILYDITYLLFSCEANRNPGALISNILFLQLVKEGKYEISQMADCLPMAMTGAIEIGRFYHNHNKLKRVNDYAKPHKAPNNTNEFIIKETALFQKFLGGTTADIGEQGLQLIEKQNTLNALIKNQKKTKAYKSKIQKNKKELAETTEEIQKIADQCIALLKKAQEKDIDKLKELIKWWYGIEVKLDHPSDDSEEDDEQDDTDGLGKDSNPKKDDPDDDETGLDQSTSSKSDKPTTKQQTTSSKYYSTIENDGLGDCAVYAVRDALKTIKHPKSDISNDNIQDLRKELCLAAKKFLPLYKLGKELEKRPSETDLSGQQHRQNNQDWSKVTDYYKDLFGDKNFVIFKAVLLKEIANRLASKGIKSETIANLHFLQALLNSVENWDKLNDNLVKQIFIKHSTLEVNIEAILIDHGLTKTPDAYLEKASKAGAWLNNSEISAYLITLGFVFESGTPSTRGSYITYRNSEDKVLYFFNNGQDNNNSSSISRGTHWMAAKLREDVDLSSADVWGGESSESEEISTIFQMAHKLSSAGMQKLKELLGSSQSLQGSGEYGEEQSIDYINPYFEKYTSSGLKHILQLRLQDLHLNNIQVLEGIFLNDTNNNIAILLEVIAQSKVKTSLMPLNLYNKHAVGLIFEKSENGIILVKYLDSLNKPIPQKLAEQIVVDKNVKLVLNELTVEHQKYGNCGPEVIENFILNLTGRRLSQEKAIELHSALFERELYKFHKSAEHLVIKYSKMMHQDEHLDYLTDNVCNDNHHTSLLGLHLSAVE